MKLYLGADHAGFELKEKMREFLVAEGYAVEDCGNTVYDEADDYPDFISCVARAVAADPENSRGIIFGNSGQGEAMVANRIKGVRAALYTGGGDDVLILSRQHNNANVLSLGQHFLTADEAGRIIKLWLGTPFLAEERHIRRIQKMDQD